MVYLTKLNNQYLINGYTPKFIDDFCLDNGEILEVEIRLVDKRKISDDQRKFIFALCNDISNYTGYTTAEVARLELQVENATIRNIEVESLSNCSMTYANELIKTIITYCISNKIPMSRSALKEYKYEFDEYQTYLLCLKRICVICGSLGADIHHVDHIGSKGNRKTMSHIGMRALPLCREHHNEFHNKGDEVLIKNYHLFPIVIDEKMEHFIKKGYVKVFKEDMKKDGLDTE